MKKVKKFLKALKNEEGVAIVMAVSLMFLLAALGGAMTTQVYQEVQLTNYNLDYLQALYLAESGVERGYQEIFQDMNWIQNVGQIIDVPIAGVDQGLYSLQVQVLTTDAGLPGNPPKLVEIATIGRYKNATRRVVAQSDLVTENVSVWNNAIFAGMGAAGGVINGNSSIHGSVHILGDNVAGGGVAITAMDLSGTSLIHNNYDGMPADLLPYIPGLSTEDFGGESVVDLDAKLRVKNGLVGMSGNSEIGSADTTGNSTKETVDGTYVTDGWTGNSVVDDGGRGDPANVYSDNGYDTLYDLGDQVTMPSLLAPYTDPSSGLSYASYDSYLSSNSLHLPSIVLNHTTSGALTIEASVLSGAIYTMNPPGTTVSYNSTTGAFKVSNAYGSINWDPKDSDGDSGGKAELEVSGITYVQGNLTLGSKQLQSSQGGIEINGKGSMYAADSGVIDIHSNILPDAIFPTDDALGLMAKDSINIATGSGDSQLKVAGAIYAENKITSKKQNSILGTFVSNYFDMGSNVPSIYQVPALATNLPPGMIGSAPVYVLTAFDQKSWHLD